LESRQRGGEGEALDFPLFHLCGEIRNFSRLTLCALASLREIFILLGILPLSISLARPIFQSS